MAAPLQTSWLLTLSLFSLIVTLCDGLGTLRQINILYRHGDRSPTATFPTDVNQEDAWPQGWGQLTNIGKQQHYKLGQFLRKRYVTEENFLNTSYVHSEILVRSTDKDRTLMSAASNLAGLYPPEGDQVWNESIAWQPIPIHTVPFSTDSLLVVLDVHCKTYEDLFSDVLTSPEVRREEQSNAAFYKFIKQKTGMAEEKIGTIWMVYDSILCERIHNKTKNSWMNETLFSKMKQLDDYQFDLMFKTKKMQKLRGGLLVNEIINNMNLKVAELKGTYNKTVPKLYMYSAHDTTVAALLSALQLYNNVAPPYASTVMLELHEINGTFKVEIYYRNDSMHNSTFELIPLTRKGCDPNCELEQFINLNKDVRIDQNNWDIMCNNVVTPTPISNKYLTIIAAVAGAFTSLLLVLIIGCTVSCVRRKRAHPYSTMEVNT